MFSVYQQTYSMERRTLSVLLMLYTQGPDSPRHLAGTQSLLNELMLYKTTLFYIYLWVNSQDWGLGAPHYSL